MNPLTNLFRFAPWLRRVLPVFSATLAYAVSAQTTIIEAPTQQEFGNFGIAAASLDTQRFIISAYQIDEGANISVGRAYLHSLSGTLLATFTNPVPTTGAFFGNSVGSLTSNRVLVGASETLAGGLTNTGAAYLFATNGTLLRSFPNPAPAEYALFGSAVAGLPGGLIAIGAEGVDVGLTLGAGRVYLYNTNGTLLRTFNDPSPSDFASFGFALAPLDANRLVIGAYGTSRGFDSEGAAFVFHTNGTLLATITNPFPAEGAGFGYALAALGSDRMVIGAYGVTRAGQPNAGEAYLYRSSGALLAVLTNPAPIADAAFGGSVAVVDDDKILIGADAAPLITPTTTNAQSGAAYLFSTNGTLLATFTNVSGRAFDRFGWAIAGINSNRFLATAPQFTLATNAPRAGRAYVMTLPPLPGTNVALSITGNSGTRLLSWQTIPHRILQETTNLTPPVVWTNSPLTVTTNGVTNSATVPVNSGPAFRAFRLRLP